MTAIPMSISEYRRLRTGRRQILVHRDYRRFTQRISGTAKRFDGLRGPFRKVGSATTSKVFLCKLSFHDRYMTLFVKHHLYRSLTDFAKHLVRPSRAMREFRASLMLARCGFAVPDVVAVGRIRAGLFRTDNFLITRALEGSKSLYLCCGRGLDDGTFGSLQDRRDLIDRLGEVIGQMHAKGICHGDLRPGNVFAQKAEGIWKFAFLDNERTRKPLWLPKKLVVKNLVQVGMFQEQFVGRTDRMRFLRSYLRANPRFSGNYKEFARLVYSTTQARLRGKPLPPELSGPK